ncbi:hypothetical protein, partial [Mycolicibacterium insubricum]|uniref:hypothetical protein n=1 Tax=Mycolicibacterium insubricum TaxID=444597 RepID=UPI0021F34EE1
MGGRRPVPGWRSGRRHRATARQCPGLRGTINGAGALEIEATRRAEDSTLARVVKLVSEAKADTSSSQRF